MKITNKQLSFLSEDLAPAYDPSYVPLRLLAVLRNRCFPAPVECFTTQANAIFSKTLTLPKPLVEFGNRPMILHQVESLAAAGVTDIVLAVNYRPDVMVSALKKVRSNLPMVGQD